MVPLRLHHVAGHEGRLNDILFLPASVRPCTPREHQTLVFFGGDIQDYPELMGVHPEYRNFQHWNLENTARLLANFFPDKHIVVVRPSRIELKSFSCFDNFVPSNNAGVPEHTGTHGALRHLERLLAGVSCRLRQMPRVELQEALSGEPGVHLQNAAPHSPAAPARRDPARRGSSTDTHPPEGDAEWWSGAPLESSRLTLVGFSKGCVVLNQLLYEFHYTHTLTPGEGGAASFMTLIDSMYWLDGGHAGDKHTWLTTRGLLETLARTGITVHIHVSPYQVCDETRPWIGREEKLFSAMLAELGAKVSRYMHGGEAPCSLHTHFDVLANFKRVQDAAAGIAAPAAGAAHT